MSFSSEPLGALRSSLSSVDILVEYATSDSTREDDSRRKLFLKLSVVLMVTRLQVFVETLLKEFCQFLGKCNLDYSNLPVFAKLTSMRLLITDLSLEKKLQNTDAYSDAKFQELKSAVLQLNSHFAEDVAERNLNFKTLFPLGKTGSKELIELFRQFEGRDIFSGAGIDINVLDGLLLTRHLIIHHDIAKDLTETVVSKYRTFVQELGEFSAAYLENLVETVGIRT